MKTPYEFALRDQFFKYLDQLAARIRFSNGARSNLEVAVQPDTQGNGVWLYMIDNMGESDGKLPPIKLCFRLTPKNARRLAHALLFLTGESEVDEREEVLTPTRG